MQRIISSLNKTLEIILMNAQDLENYLVRPMIEQKEALNLQLYASQKSFKFTYTESKLCDFITAQ